MTSLLPGRRGILLALAIAVATGAILLAMGREPICTCGSVKLWWGSVQSSENSQHVADWYSFSHVIHGLLFYFFAHVLWRRLPASLRAERHDPEGVAARSGLLRRLRPLAMTRLPAAAAWALPIAVAFEGFWELLENSPMIIERYRAVTVSLGYNGDSAVNSLSDIGFMVLGFVLASRLPAWTSVALAAAFELFTLAMIRDNLTLNVLMLVWPIDAVRAWQAG